MQIGRVKCGKRDEEVKHLTSVALVPQFHPLFSGRRRRRRNVISEPRNWLRRSRRKEDVLF